MAVRIRLKRFGAKKQPTYRFVVADSREARTGKFIEAIGFYNPLTDPATIVVDAEKVREWIRKGAQPTDSVRMLLVRAGVWNQVKNGSTPAAGGQIEAGVAEKAAAPGEGATA